jgi:endo-1,4-beta-xylanase
MHAETPPVDDSDSEGTFIVTEVSNGDHNGVWYQFWTNTPGTASITNRWRRRVQHGVGGHGQRGRRHGVATGGARRTVTYEGTLDVDKVFLSLYGWTRDPHIAPVLYSHRQPL